MKENNMKPRLNRGALQGSEKRPLIQTRQTPSASQTVGAKPFTGKVFFLDLASNRVAETLESDIKDLGGTVEKFFSKEIKYLISNKREAKYVQCLRQDSPVPSPESGPSSPQAGSSPHQVQNHGDTTKKDTVASSRGKSLVKRVVKEQERIHMNAILSNALDWGVKILYLDDVLAYVQKKKKTFCSQQPAATVKKNIKTATRRISQRSKGGRISKPFVKVEDVSRHYRPFFLCMTNIPEFNLSTLPPFSPFCAEEKAAPGNRPQDQRGVRASASDGKQNERKKKKQGGYCEGCLVKYDNITSHVQSERHKKFAKSNNYSVVDKLVSAMSNNFTVRSKLKRRKCSVSSPVLVSPRPSVENLRLEELDPGVNVQILPSNERRAELCNSELDSKPSCPALCVRRINKRKKHKHKPLSHQDLTVEDDQAPHADGELAPPAGDPGEVQPSDHRDLELHRGGTSPSVTVQTEPSERVTETKLQSSLCGAVHSRSLVHKQMTDIFQTYNSSEDFKPVRRIQRKIKVYKRKRRKVASPVVSESEEQREEGLMRLLELFQASDDMDLEFCGFE